MGCLYYTPAATVRVAITEPQGWTPDQPLPPSPPMTGRSTEEDEGPRSVGRRRAPRHWPPRTPSPTDGFAPPVGVSGRLGLDSGRDEMAERRGWVEMCQARPAELHVLIPTCLAVDCVLELRVVDLCVSCVCCCFCCCFLLGAWVGGGGGAGLGLVGMEKKVHI